MCDSRNLHQITGSRIVRTQADGGGEFTNQKVRDLCWEKNITLSYSPAHEPSSNAMHGWYSQEYRSSNAQTSTSRQRMVVVCLSIRGTYDARESSRKGMGIWKSHDKAQAKSLDDRGSVGYLLDIDVWQSGITRIMQDGIAVKGLAPKRLDPAKYHLNPRTDLNDLEKGVLWRTIQDEFGKFK